MGINKKRLPIKLHFFFCLAGAAPVAPFIPLMMKELGFSATIAGSILTVIPMVSMFAKPFVGAIADRYKIHRSVLISLLLLNIALMMLFRFIPRLPTDSSASINCTSETSQLIIPTNKASDQCFVNSLSSTTNASDVVCKFSLKGPISETNSVAKKLMIAPEHTMLPTDVTHLKLSLPYKMDSKTIGVHVQSFQNTSVSGQNGVTNCESTDYLVGDFYCDDPQFYEIITKPIVRDSDVLNYHQFWILLGVVLTMRVVGSCSENLSDSICFKMLGGSSYDYGLQRMWGSAGWGITSVVAGILVDKMSEGKALKDRSVAFYLSAAISLVDALICLKLKVKDVHTKKQQEIWSKVRTTIKENPKFLIFLFLVTACGIFSAFVWNFLFWLIEDIAKEDGCTDLSRVQTLNGLALSVNCYLGEIPFFFMSGWLLKKISYEHCMTLVLATFGFRFIAYYFLVNPWWILPLEALNGITFGLFYSTMTTYTNALTPSGLQGTMQGFVSATFEGFGLSIGSLLGGYLFDYVGGRKLFLLGGGFALFLAAFHAALLLCLAQPNDDGTIFESSVDDKFSIASQGFTLPPDQISSDKEEDWD